MIDINTLKDKFEESVFENLNRENFNSIIHFLLEEKCGCVEDIVEDYLDLFNLEYTEFVRRYNVLNEKYEGKYLTKVSEDMSLLEEFYEV